MYSARGDENRRNYDNYVGLQLRVDWDRVSGSRGIWPDRRHPGTRNPVCFSISRWPLRELDYPAPGIAVGADRRSRRVSWYSDFPSLARSLRSDWTCGANRDGGEERDSYRRIR